MGVCGFVNSTMPHQLLVPIGYFLPSSVSCHVRLDFEQVYRFAFRHKKFTVKPQPASSNTLDETKYLKLNSLALDI